MSGGIDCNEELWPKAVFTHTPGATATTHGVPDKDVHLSKSTLEFSEFEPDVGEGIALWRFSVTRLIHGIAIETSGGEGFAETKQIFL